MNETELVERLEKLERDNQRLKRLGAAALVVIAALGATYMTSCSSLGRRSGTNGVLTAGEFDMLDSSGKVRVKIAMDCSVPKSCWPAIDLYDESEKSRTVIGAGTLGITGEKSNTTLLDRGIQVESISSGGHLGDIANLGVGLGGPGAEVTLSGPGGLSVQLRGQSLLPGGEGGVLDLVGRNGNSVYLESDSPLIEIAEGKGSYMDLGSTGLATARTGATEQTSAASIVMFGTDKQHHVIWKAP